MAKKLNSMPDFTAHLAKHPHDVSQSTAYTACPGMLCPVYFDMLHTGDELHFSASEFVRLNPLENQPLGEIDVHLDYFFVPLTVMYLPSSSLFYQTDDLVSGMFDEELQLDSFPLFDFKNFLDQCSRDVNPNLFGQTCVFSTSYNSGNTKSYLPIDGFDSFGVSVFRMFDFLDMAPEVLLSSITNEFTTSDYPLFTPWFALAYQAIYQLYYRNDDREGKNYHYNIDKYYNGDLITEDISSVARVKSIFQINYASRPKDYFNSVKVSPISSNTSLLSGSTLQTLYQNVNAWLSTTIVSGQTRTGTVGTLGVNETQVGYGQSALLSTANVRQMFMVEKLLRTVGRAEKNFESQFLAHYGIKIPHDVMHNITHIGHDMITIKPEAVISQANTFNGETGSALGEIGGKGSGMLSGRKHNFTAPFHGVFLCISHIIPRRRYVLGLNKLHQLYQPNQFWQPEFDQKGMQPLFSFEDIFNDANTSMTSMRGWQFAYEQFKRKSDRVSRAFTPHSVSSASVNSYAPWVIASTAFGYIRYDSRLESIFDADPVLPWHLLVSPNDLNINMQMPHDGRWSANYLSSPWLIYQTDPFICDFNMYCKKVNGMSEYGEPEL